MLIAGIIGATGIIGTATITAAGNAAISDRLACEAQCFAGFLWPQH